MKVQQSGGDCSLQEGHERVQQSGRNRSSQEGHEGVQPLALAWMNRQPSPLLQPPGVLKKEQIRSGLERGGGPEKDGGGVLGCVAAGWLGGPA
jgi:hypothetical protein